MKNRYFYLLLALFALTQLSAQTTAKIEYFDLKDIDLLDSPFKHAEELDKQYLLEMDADRLLAPFIREAGLEMKTGTYTNWEDTGLDGHIGGHYITALSLMYASTGDQEIKVRLDHVLSELERVQEANGNGYIGGVPGSRKMWQEIADGDIRAGGFSLNDKWVPLYNIHKTYAGLRDAYWFAGSESAKNMLIKFTDWMIDITANLSDDQMQDMLRSEHGGLNETFADVAAITGDDKYLDLAKRFSQLFILNPLLKGEDHLTGMHANTQIPKVLGYKRIADIEGNNEWAEASRFFWETVVERRSVSIGGNSANEHFHPSDDFTRMVNSNEGPETCNTYNMLRLTRMLYQTSLDKKYMDYYERALYNHILSTQHPETGGLVYFTQMRPGHYRVYSQPHTSMWCCVGSGIENHAKYGEMIYAHNNRELFVNLFIPSRLDWKQQKTEIVQKNNFPEEGVTEITVNPKRRRMLTINLRNPSWVSAGALKVTVNGRPTMIAHKDGYVSLTRKWRKGDVIRMEMPMELVAEQLPDNSNYYSFSYGPIVLAAKTSQDDMVGLFADDSRGGHIAHGKLIPLNEMPTIVSNPVDVASKVSPVAGKPLTFKVNSLYPSKYASGLELIPFYKLHESRYVIYWPQATEQEVVELQRKIEEEERELQKLNNITIDRLTSGEQQPESDHFIEFDDSWTGSVNGVSWRECRGFFSYKLRNPNKEARQLHVTYFDRDRDRNLKVMVNGVEVYTAKMKGDKGDDLQVVVIDIPESEQSTETLVVKFAPAESGATTNKITNVRLLK